MTKIEINTVQDRITCLSCLTSLTHREQYYTISQTYNNSSTLWLCTECIKKFHKDLSISLACDELQQSCTEENKEEVGKQEYNRFDYIDLD